MKNQMISIAKEFSDTPAGRYRTDGPFSGEQFRDEYLFPALRDNDHVEIDLDGALGYGSSFLEEAFGGLVRECKMEFEEIQRKLEIKSTRSIYREKVWQYIRDAANSSK